LTDLRSKACLRRAEARAALGNHQAASEVRPGLANIWIGNQCVRGCCVNKDSSGCMQHAMLAMHC
jgi:hypothetical protein